MYIPIPVAIATTTITQKNTFQKLELSPTGVFSLIISYYFTGIYS
jgi:hypothetical protein